MCMCIVCVCWQYPHLFRLVTNGTDRKTNRNFRTLKEVAELRRQIAIEHAARHKKAKVLDSDVPTEFECCFCTTKVCVSYSSSNSLQSHASLYCLLLLSM